MAVPAPSDPPPTASSSPAASATASSGPGAAQAPTTTFTLPAGAQPPVAGLDGHLAAIATFFETMSPDDLPGIDRWYTQDAWFKDPFNEVTGVPAIRGVFHHMYLRLDEPRFRVHERLGRDDQAFLTWTFEFRFRGERQPRAIRGSTHLRLAPDGRIRWHRDYWDAAEELYEKLPVLGSLMRWLKRQARR